MPGVARGLLDVVQSPHGIGTLCGDPQVYTTSAASVDVFVNGVGAVRMLDAMFPHPNVGCEVHSPVLVYGSFDVFVNGLGIGRLADYYATPDLVPHPITTASINVFVNGPDPVE